VPVAVVGAHLRVWLSSGRPAGPLASWLAGWLAVGRDLRAVCRPFRRPEKAARSLHCGASEQRTVQTAAGGLFSAHCFLHTVLRTAHTARCTPQCTQLAASAPQPPDTRCGKRASIKPPLGPYLLGFAALSTRCCSPSASSWPVVCLVRLPGRLARASRLSPRQRRDCRPPGAEAEAKAEPRA